MIIGSTMRYARGEHRWALGLKVQIVSVHRDDGILTDDTEIGELLPDDLIEFRPWMETEGRWSFVTSDASIDELDPI